MVVQFIQVLPLAKREYTDRNGQAATFKSKGFVIHNGDGTLYVEATQELAEKLESLNIEAGACALVQIGSVAREYKTNAGETRYSNELTFRNVQML